MTITLKIRDVTLSGDGIGNLENGKTVFVSGALAEETIEINVTEEKKKFAKAQIKNILEASPEREDAKCVHAKVCGGCSFWHVKSHFSLKQNAAFETIRRISKIPLPSYEGLHDETPDEGWRIRATYHWNGVRLGFHSKQSNEVISSYECLVVTPEIREAVLHTRDAFRNSRTHLSDVRFEMDGDKVFVTSKSFALKKLADTPGISGIKIQDKIFGERQKVSVPIRYMGKTEMFDIEPGMFRQSNTKVNDLIGEFVENEIDEGSDLSEYFCGYGNLSFRVLSKVKSLKAYEASSDAIMAAKKIAKKLNCDGYDFSRIDLFKTVPKPSPLVLLDPPRAGAQLICERLASGKECTKIIYVSCDPATLARDLALLSVGGFEVKKLLFADMFPRSSHIETIAILER